ncbi:MAG: ribosome maturation factor RimM [Oleiphilaceae bacterium]|nr:ribosome maturation factor RimM [Oleiphilaceae bacterium]
MTASKEYAVMGKITSVYGVKGWVKVFSYMQPKENICRYSQWLIERGGVSRTVHVLNCKTHGNGVIAQLEGVNDREQAREYADFLISIPVDTLPELEAGEYYWRQLEGLFVRHIDGTLLGSVSHLIETGSNDVLVVRKCKGSIDGRERLVPYLPDQVIKSVDLDRREITVEWDPEF